MVSQHEEHLEAVGERKTRGAYYTPAEVVDGLLRLCLDPLLSQLEPKGPTAVASVRILDPTCGAGHFLVAALRRIQASLCRGGLSSGEAGLVALNCVVGIDLDPAAVELCRAELRGLAGASDGDVASTNIRCADSLVMPLEAPLTLFTDPGDSDWATLLTEVDAPEGFDLVIGNPPFLSQLKSATAFPEEYTARIEQRFGELARGYADPAALFLLVGAQVLKQQSGRLCLIEPVSVLSSRGAAGVRHEVARSTGMTHAWFAEEQIFDGAAVEVWAPVLDKGVDQESVHLLTGSGFAPFGETSLPVDPGNSWGCLLAAVRGVPSEDWQMDGVLGDVADATADFRDQFYGLSGHVHDGLNEDDGPMLITSGLIDPARLLWGERSTKFNRDSYVAPRVDVASLDEAMQVWVKRRLVPKVLLATQTRVLEPVVDERGVMLPSVPVLTIEPSGRDLWSIAALLVCAPISAIAASRHFGAALSSDALKLAARDVLGLPLPAGRQHWSEAASAFRIASEASDEGTRREYLLKSGQLMCLAFGVRSPDALLRWWSDRLPHQSGPELVALA